MTYLMEIDNLGKRYDDFELSGVSLAVEPGCVVGFIGSNGAGKTTTIKAALGILAADEGAVRLFGQPIACGSPELDTIKSRIGVVLDTCAFPDTCRVGDVGAIGRAAYREWDAVQFAALCDRFNLAPKKKVGELSRGMGMKLTLAFALSHNPELLVLDEATAGLDPIARDEVLAFCATSWPRAIAASSCPPISPPTWRRSPTRSSAWTPAASCLRPPRMPSPTRPAWPAAAPPT